MWVQQPAGGDGLQMLSQVHSRGNQPSSPFPHGTAAVYVPVEIQVHICTQKDP